MNLEDKIKVLSGPFFVAGVGCFVVPPADVARILTAILELEGPELEDAIAGLYNELVDKHMPTIPIKL